jgi:hypothetical protein
VESSAGTRQARIEAGTMIMRPSRWPLSRPPQDEEYLWMPRTINLFLRSAARRVSKDASRFCSVRSP